DQINKKLDKILRILETKLVDEQPKSKKPKKFEEEKPKEIENLPVLEEPKSIEIKKPKKKAKKKK
ncbi:MAG: enterotoxin, partial [Nanoarchaeota archaeon]|nr:enterotoxin [Nanoarchaeota archaeon]